MKTPFHHVSQKPRVGLLIAIAALIVMGSGCSDLGDQINSGLSTAQAKIDDMKAAFVTWQQNYEKAKAIYNILNSDASDKTSDASTPSVPASADQQPPATEENTSSQ